MLLRRLLPLLALVACAAPPAEQSVDVSFVLKAGDKPAGCGLELPGLGTKGTAAHLSDARLYLGEVALIDAAGKRVPLSIPDGPWQSGGVALIDFENAAGACRGTQATNTRVVGTVPAGRYSGLSFTIGVPVPLNHTSHVTAPPPLDSVAMSWSWQAGRKFLKIELDPAGGVSRPKGARPSSSWYLHLGSTGCVGDPSHGEAVACSRPNRILVEFPAFDTRTQQVAVDLLPLFAATDITLDQGGAPGCMSGVDDADCPAVFRQLGLDLSSGRPADGGPKFLRVEARP